MNRESYVPPGTHPIPEHVLVLMRKRVQGNPDECWLWPLNKTRNGYGRVSYNDLDGAKRTTTAHRASYSAFVGPIPLGWSVDHLCRIRDCWNPAHLRVLTLGDNSRDSEQARQTHCPQGHAYDEANTYIYLIRPSDTRRGGPSRYCRMCRRASVRASKAKARYLREAAS